MTPRIHNFFSLVPKHKLLLGSFIFLSLYSGALYTFATTYVSPGTILDPLGIPGSYTVTPPLTYGGAVTSGHDGEILYIDGSGNLVSDALFVREAATGNFLVAQSFGLDEFASFQLNDTKQSAQMAYNNTATGERAQISTGGGPIQVDASYEDGVSILGEFILANGGNTLAWDADTTDDLSDFFIQAQNISGAGINGTLIGHSDSNTQEHAISAWGDFTGQGGQAFQAITSVGSGDIEVGHTVSPANGYQISYQDIGINTTANLTLDGNANILTFDADTTDTITYGLEQDENILGLGLVSGSFNYYEDTNTDLVTMSGSGDFTPGGGNPATSIILTKSTTTDDIAGFQTSYDPGFPEMNAVGQVVNGTNQASLILNSTDSDLIFSPDSGTSMSGMTANSIASYLFRNDGTTNWAAGISDGLFEVKDLTNSKDYLKVNMTSGLYQLGDIDEVDNGNLLTIDDNAGEVNIEVSTRLQIQEAVTENVWFLVEPGNALVQAGDITGVGNSTLFTLRDSTGFIRFATDADFNIGYTDDSADFFIVDIANGNYSLGDNGTAVNGTYLGINDATEEITLTANNSLLFKNAAGNEWFKIAPDSGNQYVRFGDNDSVFNGTRFELDDVANSVTLDAQKTIVSGGFLTQGINYITTAASPYTVSVSDYILGVNSTAGPITVILPATPINGETHTIKDVISQAGTNNITIDPNGYSINGFPSYVISSNYGGVTIYFDGAFGSWFVQSTNNETVDKLGDVDFSANGTRFFVDDSSQMMFANADNGIIVDDNNSHTCIIDANGGTCTSDERLKTNINDLPSNTLDILSGLRTVTYTWNSGKDLTSEHVGFLAQNIQSFYPQLVETNPNGYLGVNYAGFTPLLVEAVREINLKLKPLEDLMTSENTVASVLRNWLANTANGITSIFSKEVVTEQICVKDENGQTCLTRSQLDALISGGGSGSTSGGTGSTSGTTTGDSSSSGTTTDGTTSGDTTGSGDTGTTTGGDPDIGGTTTTTTTTGGGDTGIPL